jgi:hypothetical protein
MTQAALNNAAAKLRIPPTTLESKIKSLKINKHRFNPTSCRNTLSLKIQVIFYYLSLIRGIS